MKPLQFSLICVVFLTACGLGYETRISNDRRDILTLELNKNTVGFAISQVNDHLGLAPTGPGGGMPTGMQFPKNQWWPMPVITVKDADGINLELIDDRERRWFQIGPAASRESKAKKISDSITIETCAGDNVIIYHLVGNGFATPWAAVYTKKHFASHSTADMPDAATCAIALAGQRPLIDVVLATRTRNSCEDLRRAGLDEAADRCLKELPQKPH